MSKLIKVTCSYCRNEMDCPEDMAKMTNNHICEKCVESPERIKDKKLKNFTMELKGPLDDISLCSDYSIRIAEASFPSYLLNEEFSKLSREELAKEMFIEGIATALFGFSAIGNTEKDFKEVLNFHKLAKETIEKIKKEK